MVSQGFFNSETGHWQSNARDVEFDIAFAGISDDEDSVELQPRSAICTAVCGGTPYEDISDDDLVSDSNAIAKAIAKTKRDEAQLHTARGLLRIGSDSRVRALQESPPSSRAPSASLQRYARPIDSKVCNSTSSLFKPGLIFIFCNLSRHRCVCSTCCSYKLKPVARKNKPTSKSNLFC